MLLSGGGNLRFEVILLLGKYDSKLVTLAMKFQ
jgi:hypothetical protein